MNFNYYREFNPELSDMSKNELINYFHYNAKKEIKIFNEETFYYFYPDFDYLLYGSINKDLTGYSKFKLQKHYHLHGKNESRIHSKKKFYECYPNFVLENNDLNNSVEEYEILSNYHNNNIKLSKKNNNNNYMDINYYREFNPDLKGYRDDYLRKYFLRYGDKEKKIYNEETFYEFYPDFDYDFYKNMYNELYNYSNFDAQLHYHNFGLYENRIISLKYFYKRFPNFDIEFYKNFNDELIDKDDNMIIYKHYYQIGHIENRICCLDNFNGKYNNFIEIFNNENLDFDIYFYSHYYEDLLLFKNKLKLMHHYYFIGSNENRYISENDFNNKNPNFINNFKKNYPDFDINYFKNFYKLYDLTDILLMIYFERHKNIKYKIYNNDSYLKVLNEFDYVFYKKYYDDLQNYNTNEELLDHYKYIGIIENRLINEYYFNKIYQDFDINFYKTFYNDLNILSNIEAIIHYMKYGKNEKRFSNIIEFDNKYYDFDVKIYKDKNNDLKYLNDYELRKHFFEKGQYERRIYNDKIKICIVCEDYPYTKGFGSGGNDALYGLAKYINEINYKKFYAKLFVYSQNNNNNPYCNNFSHSGELNDNTILIYSDGMLGNPFNAKNIVRWILLEIGTQYRDKNTYKTWGVNDLVYHWEKTYYLNSNLKILNSIKIDDDYKNLNELRQKNKSCYLIKKRFFFEKKINYVHPLDSILIDNLSKNEIIELFNTCEYFYCYDIKSCYIIYSILCGCKLIIIPYNNITKKDYCKFSILENFIEFEKMFSYGIDDMNNNIIDNVLINKFKDYLLNIPDKSIKSFLDDIEKYINKIENNIPTVESVYINSNWDKLNINI